MVVLTRIYTRGGDKGKTSLGDGTRLVKHHLRVEAIGTIDEANAAIGVARTEIQEQLQEYLTQIQNDLFDIGADLCIPRQEEQKLQILPVQVRRLEQAIDHFNQALLPLNSFVLPGGIKAAAYLHLARTIVRRAERRISELSAQAEINPTILRYLNRLSDFLFVLSRYVNNKGQNDSLWQPGSTQ